MGVMTAPLATIKVNNVIIGKMKNVRVNESYQRGRVVGLGSLNASELPATSFTGTLNASYYVIDFNEHPFLDTALLRKTGNPANFINTVLLDEAGFDIDLIKKVPDLANFPNGGRDADGIIQTDEVIFATVRKVFITSDSFDISEGQIAGRDGAFEYLDPIVFQV